MVTVKQIALSLKRAETKIAKLSKELSAQKETKAKLSAALKAAKLSAPKKSKKMKVLINLSNEKDFQH